MLVTPSKYVSLDFLRQLDADHFIGASGKEYSEEEVNELKWQKLQAMADKQVKELIK